METFVYLPKDVCSRKMTISYEGDVIAKLEVEGGCNGNLQGIASLVKGMRIDEAIARLEGIPCRGSRTKATSCPDQFAQALKALKQDKGI